MEKQTFSTAHIEYLEKDFLDTLHGKIDPSSLNISKLEEVRFLKISGISNFWELDKGKIISLRLFMQDILSGLYEGGIPLIFAIFGRTDKVEILLGTHGDGNRAEDGLGTIRTALKSSFQGIELKEESRESLKKNIEGFGFCSLVTGTPAEKEESEKVGVEQIERMIRGLYGREWGYLVIANHATNSEINSLFNLVMNELRIVMNSEKSLGMESPIGKKYKELLPKI